MAERKTGLRQPSWQIHLILALTGKSKIEEVYQLSTSLFVDLRWKLTRACSDYRFS
jgi:hypothetical protein